MQPDSADQSTTRPAPESDDEDLLLRLTREHRDAAGLVVALQRRTGPDAGDDAAGTARELVTDLVRHALTERIHLLPLLRRHVPDGDATADRVEAGQQQLEYQVQQLEGLPVTDDFWRRLASVDDLLTRHAQELESHLFPALAAACPAEELRAAGVQAARTARTATTRPHPHAREGATLAAAAQGAGLVDRIRDLFRN